MHTFLNTVDLKFREVKVDLIKENISLSEGESRNLSEHGPLGITTTAVIL